MAIIGPSGSGKSSFVYCGILPILYGGFLTGTRSEWEVIVTRPGAAPIDNLAAAILAHSTGFADSDEAEKRIKQPLTTASLRSSSWGLAEVISRLPGSEQKNYLVLVDQFEELFRFKADGSTADTYESLAFVNLLTRAVEQAGAQIHVAITLRSDFIGGCTHFPHLTQKINDSQYLIPQMTREQKKSAITGPVAVSQSHITPRLVQRLLNDLGEQSDQLPVLQHALMRTWDYREKNSSHPDEPLDVKHYEAIGTMSEALSMHANEAYDELTEAQKRICESLFKTITEKRGGNFGIRRPTRLDKIAAIAGVNEAAVTEVIDKFRNPGRALLIPNHTVVPEAHTVIDISHESLMRIWTRLKNWVDEEAGAVRMYLRLAEAAEAYQMGRGGLWRPPDLQLALNWQMKHRPTLPWGQLYHPAYERTMVFLEYSKKELETGQRIKELQAKRRLRNARFVALVLGTATIVSLLFLMFAFYQRTIAERNAEEADRQRAIAEENLRIAKAQKARATENEKKAGLQKEIADRKTIQAQEALEIAEHEKQRAEAGEIAATNSAQEAQAAKAIAERQETIATQQKENAQRSKQAAERLRMLAIAKTMAVKSGKLRKNQATLKALLALQAYQFNTHYDGDPYDNDIYNGLYAALREFGDPLIDNLPGHRAAIQAIATAPGAVFTADNKGKIIKWSVGNTSPRPEVIAQERPGHLIRTIDAAPDGRVVIAAGKYPSFEGASYVEAFALPEKTRLPITGFVKEVWKLIIMPGGHSFIALDNEGRSIRRSDFDTVYQVKATSARLNDMVLSKDGKYLIGAGNDRTVYRYEVENNYRETTLFDNNSKVLAVAVSRENIVAIGDEEGMVKLFPLFNPRNIVTFIGHTSPVEDVAFGSDGHFLASASRDRTVRLWDRKDYNAPPIKLEDHPDWVLAIGFSPGSSALFAGTRAQTLKAWPAEAETMARNICGKISRNMSPEEWETYAGKDIDYNNTCEQYGKGR